MNSRIAWYRSSGNSLTTLTWTAAASKQQNQSDKAVSCHEKQVLSCLPGGLLLLLCWPKLPAAAGQEERAFPSGGCTAGASSGVWGIQPVEKSPIMAGYL